MSRSAPLNVEIMYFDAGGGHRAAAFALRDALAAAGYGWRVELVQVQQLLQSLDPVFRVTGLPSEEFYNKALKRGWTYGSRPFLRMVQQGIALEAPAFKRRLRAWWANRRPGLVVSVVPNFNRIMFEVLAETNPGVPYVTIMTDMADVPPRFWMEPQDQYLVCGTRKAAVQAALTGYYRPERVFEVSGMIVRPGFYAALAAPQRLSRAALGLGDDIVALIMFGGNGSEESTTIVDKLTARGIRCIVMCGRNEELLQQLQGRPGVAAIPYTERVADYMRLADFMIGKPGPGSISEAVLAGLAVIVTHNARTMIQERYNVVWLEEQGVGLAIPGYEKLDAAVDYLLRGGNLAEFRRRAAGIRNRAVFEVPPLLAEIVERHERSAGDEIAARPAA